MTSDLLIANLSFFLSNAGMGYASLGLPDAGYGGAINDDHPCYAKREEPGIYIHQSSYYVAIAKSVSKNINNSVSQLT